MNPSDVYGGGGIIDSTVASGDCDPTSSNSAQSGQPYIRIIEQPAKCALRFRYECEGRSAGSIPGANSTSDNKTYPSIQIVNFQGPAVVVVSCVTKDYPYRPHPHNLVGKDGCKKGVCTMVINNPDMICNFTSLGIQCVKRRDIEDSLKLRESIKVDPFRTGFSHKNQASNIDLNVVRLCFQVFIEGNEKSKFNVPLLPIVSELIFDKKAMTDLVITKLSHFSAPVTGGKEVILLCDRVTKDDIQIRFYQQNNNGKIVWEGFGEFQANDVHKQVAISFRTPSYGTDNIDQPVQVYLQLKRPSDGCTSEPRMFQFTPKYTESDGLARKRKKIDESWFNKQFKESDLLADGGATIPVDLQNFGLNNLTENLNLLQTRQQHPFEQTPGNMSLNVQSQEATVAQLINALKSHERLNDDMIDDKSRVRMMASGTVESAEASGLNIENIIGGGENYMSSMFASNISNNNAIDGQLTSRLDSLDLDIDVNDLQLMMETFNSATDNGNYIGDQQNIKENDLMKMTFRSQQTFLPGQVNDNNGNGVCNYQMNENFSKNEPN